VLRLPFKRYQPGDEFRIEPPPPGRTARLLRYLEWPERIHRYEVHGLEHVPRSGPALLVSHHPYGVVGMFCLGKRLFERDGRVPRGLTEHVAFMIPGLRDLFATLGVVDGNQDNGLALLSSGQLAACMPGGALEWSRSSRQRRELRWGEHRGYARLAVRAGVPVIPLACPAADDLYWVLYDGWRLGGALQRWLGLGRNYPFTIGVGLGPLPLPVKLTHHVAPPEHPLGPEHGTEEERTRELDQRVRAVVRELLSRP
jgi:1-acyl-sn-glycerol-3-phosphate acyltransferase